MKIKNKNYMMIMMQLEIKQSNILNKIMIKF